MTKPPIHDQAPGASEEGNHNPGNSKAPTEFLGTDNPLHLRVIQAATVPPTPREDLDKVAGCGNGPDLVAELRRRGLEMPRSRTKKLDRNLFDCWPAVYHLTQRDRRKLVAWRRERAAGRDCQ